MEDHATANVAGEGDRPMAVPMPDEHVGAFVAEVFEDLERSTSWETVVGKLVPPGAREDWAALSAREQVEELLRKADEFDERAVELLEDVPTDPPGDESEVEPTFDEAMRCRRNADILRNGIADGYDAGRVDDEELVAAVEAFGFDTERIARREDLLETVASLYDFEFRPYGGTLMDAADDGSGGDRGVGGAGGERGGADRGVGGDGPGASW